jgi:hypothetical protein
MPNWRTARLIASATLSAVGGVRSLQPGGEQRLASCVVNVQPGHRRPPRGRSGRGGLAGRRVVMLPFPLRRRSAYTFIALGPPGNLPASGCLPAIVMPGRPRSNPPAAQCE